MSSVTTLLTNVKTIAAIATKPAPATASTDCRLSWEVGRAVVAGVAAGVAAGSERDGGAIVAPAPAPEATAAEAEAVAAVPRTGILPSASSRLLSAVTAASDAVASSSAAGPIRSAPQLLHQPSLRGLKSQRGHMVQSTRFRIATSLQALPMGASLGALSYGAR